MGYSTDQTDTFTVHTITYLTVSSGLRASHSDATIIRREQNRIECWESTQSFYPVQKQKNKRGHNSGNYRQVTVLICNLCSVLMHCRQVTVTFSNTLMCMFALHKATHCGMCQEEFLNVLRKENHLRRQTGQVHLLRGIILSFMYSYVTMLFLL